jgi:hypothetical protein
VIAVALAGIVLHGGQTRFFLPGALRPGEKVTCTAKGHATVGDVPSRTTGMDSFTVRGPQLDIDRRANGAIMIACGKAKAIFPPTRTMPYVIGQNGLALIRGANTLSRLEQIYGKPSETKPCRAMWKGIGLEVTFSGRSCDVLDGANVTGSQWSSLSGVHIGDSVAKMVWLTQTRSHPALGHVWVIGRGTQYRSELVAWVGSKGTVDRFTAILQRPPG